MSPRTTRRLRLTFAVLGTLTAVLGVVTVALGAAMLWLLPPQPGQPRSALPVWGGLLYLAIAATSFYAVARMRPPGTGRPSAAAGRQ